MNTIHSIELIYSNPKIRGGRPCIVGTGLRVTDIVVAKIYNQRTPDEIASDYGISLAKVYAGLAFYYENRDDIEEDIRQQIRTAQKLKEDGFDRPENSVLS